MPSGTPHDPRSLPPSFTPQGGGHRPRSADDAISVGGEHPKPRPAGGGGAPRIRRQSSREIPVTPAAAPPAFSPRRAGSGDAARRPATQHEASSTPGYARSHPDDSTAPPSVQPVSRARSATPVGKATSPPRSVGSTNRAGGPARGSTRPPGTARPAGGGPPSGTTPSRIRIRKGRLAAVIGVTVLALAIAWPIGLLVWANGKVNHVDALSGAENTGGTTYLIAGSDARGDGISEDGTTGARTDTIMILHKPDSGPTALISLPRDTYTEIPGDGAHKLNATFASGGQKGLVVAAEALTGLTIDHYVEVGFGGVEQIVDALGGVELCYDSDVDDERSELVWTAGCHVADGHTALAFSRMRYSDPKGDIGRAERQRQVIGAIGGKAANPSIVFRPGDQVTLADSVLDALVADENANVIDLARMALAFQAANGPDGITGTPPIANPDYRPGGNLGSTVLLDPETSPRFWTDIRDGLLPPGQVGGLPG